MTNGKSTENTTESSYENAVATNRTSRASIDAEYENTVTVAETNGLNGSACSSSTTNNNNIAKSELTNGNGNGNTNDNDNATDAVKRSSVNDHSNAASKDELYDVPVGEFRIYTISHKNGYKLHIRPKTTKLHRQTAEIKETVKIFLYFFPCDPIFFFKYIYYTVPTKSHN